MLELNKIYCGDCLEYMREMPDKCVDLVLTDPPYPDYLADKYGYFDGIIDFLKNIPSKQLIFWSAKAAFPLDYSAIHIWNKKCGVGSMYERIYERNGGTAYKVFNFYLCNSTVAASYTNDTFTGHPSQKPLNLIKQLIIENTHPGDLVLDPFLGSGTTAVACKKLGRNYIGIEKEPAYIEIALKRLERVNNHKITDFFGVDE